MNFVGRAWGEESGEDEDEVGSSYFPHLFRLESADGRGQNTGRNLFVGWSDPSGLLATSSWPKVGSLQPNTEPRRAQIARSVAVNCLSSLTVVQPRW